VRQSRPEGEERQVRDHRHRFDEKAATWDKQPPRVQLANGDTILLDSTAPLRLARHYHLIATSRAAACGAQPIRTSEHGEKPILLMGGAGSERLIRCR
jgi:hypothetical protein